MGALPPLNWVGFVALASWASRPVSRDHPRPSVIIHRLFLGRLGSPKSAWTLGAGRRPDSTLQIAIFRGEFRCASVGQTVCIRESGGDSTLAGIGGSGPAFSKTPPV